MDIYNGVAACTPVSLAFTSNANTIFIPLHTVICDAIVPEISTSPWLTQVLYTGTSILIFYNNVFF